jgi:hypothetical protein
VDDGLGERSDLGEDQVVAAGLCPGGAGSVVGVAVDQAGDGDDVPGVVLVCGEGFGDSWEGEGVAVEDESITPR